MAKITSYIPEPKEQYEVDNQRQILQSIETIKNELNFTFQNDLKEEQDTYNYFCLLYTSPSPRDGLLSRMPSSA